jgi:hypothetical protein
MLMLDRSPSRILSKSFSPSNSYCSRSNYLYLKKDGGSLASMADLVDLVCFHGTGDFRPMSTYSIMHCGRN